MAEVMIMGACSEDSLCCVCQKVEKAKSEQRVSRTSKYLHLSASTSQAHLLKDPWLSKECHKVGIEDLKHWLVNWV